MSIFNQVESKVRYYSRTFPEIFDKAKGCKVYDKQGQVYLDFFAGAGALNYGHNNSKVIEKIQNYLANDGILHGLDVSTVAKEGFLTDFTEKILQPREMDYKIMFCGPTGTNSVEAALKLARKVKKRNTVFAFSGAFHGMTLGSLSVTSSRSCRKGAGLPLNDVVFMPFPSGFNKSFDTIDYIENVLTDSHSGIEIPAAIIMETVQAESGVNLTSIDWLKGLKALCDKHDILLICDDIQVGCGRTGNFFSFEDAEILPDIITLSKSIGGVGLPMSLLLIKNGLDIWEPGEHNGTFRGNQLAFIAGKEVLNFYNDSTFLNHVKKMEQVLVDFIEEEIKEIDPKIEYRGKGLIYGIDLSKLEEKNLARLVATECFKRKLIIECCGRHDRVLKILPPLVISEEELIEGLTIIKQSIIHCLK